MGKGPATRLIPSATGSPRLVKHPRRGRLRHENRRRVYTKQRGPPTRRVSTIKKVQIARTSSGYLVVDARSSPPDTASVPPAYRARSEPELRSVLERLGFARQAIDQAIEEVNRVGHASISIGP